MLPTGKYIKCPNCGLIFAEPDWSPAYCTYQCERDFQEKQRKKNEGIRLKYKQEQFDRCPDYQI